MASTNKDSLALYRDLQSDVYNYIEIQSEVIAETEKAICFDFSRSDIGQRPVWVPKSQMQIVELGSDSGIRYFIKVWLWNKIK